MGNILLLPQHGITSIKNKNLTESRLERKYQSFTKSLEGRREAIISISYRKSLYSSSDISPPDHTSW